MQSGERQTAPEGLVQIILEIAIEFHVSEKRVRHAHAEHRPPVRVGLAKVVLRDQRRTPLPRAGARIAVTRAEHDAQRRDIRFWLLVALATPQALRRNEDRTVVGSGKTES